MMTMSDARPTPALLREAKAFLEQNPDRWGQGSYFPMPSVDGVDHYGDGTEPNCKMCGLGVIAHLIDPSYPHKAIMTPDFSEAEKALNEVTGRFPAWNDREGRTVQEVIDVFQVAINRLEAKPKFGPLAE